MTIERSKDKVISLSDIAAGQVFVLAEGDNNLWLRTSDMDEDDDPWCVDLADGHCDYYTKDTEVYLIPNAKVVV